MRVRDNRIIRLNDSTISRPTTAYKTGLFHYLFLYDLIFWFDSFGKRCVNTFIYILVLHFHFHEFCVFFYDFHFHLNNKQITIRPL